MNSNCIEVQQKEKREMKAKRTHHRTVLTETMESLKMSSKQASLKKVQSKLIFKDFKNFKVKYLLFILGFKSCYESIH